MRQLAWPAFAFGVATLIALLLRAVLLTIVRRWAGATGSGSSLAQAIRVPSILWSIVLGIFIGNEVARQTESLPQRLSQQVGDALEVAVIISVTITVANVLTTLVMGAGERRALGRPITGLGQAVVRGVVYIIGCLVLLGALGIQITPILTALGVGGLAVALALQDTLSNLFAGVHLLADKPIRVGDYVKVAGQVGFRGHMTVGSRVTIAGQSGVWGNVADGATVSGNPARDHREDLRREVMIRKLPKLFDRVEALERSRSAE